MKITKILEAGKPVYQPITDTPDLTELRAHLLKFAPKAFATFKADPAKVILRGINGSQSSKVAFRQDTLSSTRTSENTSNFVTLATSILSSWKSLPPRSAGVSCTNQASMAEDYGRLFVAVPFDEATVVYTGAKDFWLSLPNIRTMINSHTNVDDINNQLLRLCDDLHSMGVPQNVATEEAGLRKLFSVIDAMVDGGRMDHMKILESSPITNAFLESSCDTFEQFMSELLTPTNARVTTGGQLLSPLSSEEIFISGSIIFVNAGYWNKL